MPPHRHPLGPRSRRHEDVGQHPGCGRLRHARGVGTAPARPRGARLPGPGGRDQCLAGLGARRRADLRGGRRGAASRRRLPFQRLRRPVPVLAHRRPVRPQGAGLDPHRALPGAAGPGRRRVPCRRPRDLPGHRRDPARPGPQPGPVPGPDDGAAARLPRGHPSHLARPGARVRHDQGPRGHPGVLRRSGRGLPRLDRRRTGPAIRTRRRRAGATQGPDRRRGPPATGGEAARARTAPGQRRGGARRRRRPSSRPRPLPGRRIRRCGRRPRVRPTAASYCNFYLTADHLFAPLLDPAHDDQAMSVLSRVFPRHTVVGLPTRELLLGGGNIHCATQQIPARPPRPAPTGAPAADGRRPASAAR
nr:agmatine deiminase family protein [Streptomyces sp. DvalAA-43]